MKNKEANMTHKEFEKLKVLGDSIGFRLAATRVSRGMSREEAAQKIHISEEQLRRFESDEEELTFEQGRMLCSLYGVTMNFLLAGIRDDYMEKGLL